MKQAITVTTLSAPTLRPSLRNRFVSVLKRVYLPFWISALMMALIFAVAVSPKGRRASATSNHMTAIGNPTKDSW